MIGRRGWGGGEGIYSSLDIVESEEGEMATDWKAAAWDLERGNVHSVLCAPGSADAVTQDLTGAKPSSQVTEYKPCLGQ